MLLDLTITGKFASKVIFVINHLYDMISAFKRCKLETEE